MTRRGARWLPLVGVAAACGPTAGALPGPGTTSSGSSSTAAPVESDTTDALGMTGGRADTTEASAGSSTGDPSLPPPEPPQPHDVVQLCTGADGACARSADGRVKCWGSGTLLGQPGIDVIGDDETVLEASEIDLGGSADAISCMDSIGCAVLSRGELRCWGTWGASIGLSGDEYDPVLIGSDIPPAAAPAVPLDGAVLEVSVGYSSYCARLLGGTIRCWGGGVDQLGIPERLRGPLGTWLGDDEELTSVPPIDFGSEVPVWVGWGGEHGCVLTDAGVGYCWGGPVFSNILANGIGDNDLTPLELGPLPLPAIAQIIPSAWGTCARFESGAVRCWGVTVGRGVVYRTPAARMPDLDVGGPAVKLWFGWPTACVRLESGDVRCWGQNDDGALGLGHTEPIGDDEPPSSAPVLAFSDEILDMSLGIASTCALLRDYRVLCWGSGSAWRLGNGSTENIGDDELPDPRAAFGVFDK